MSVLYSFVQADNEESAQMLINYYTEADLMPVPDFKPGRTPTFAELRQALDQTDGYKVEYDVNKQHWDVHFETPDGIQTWIAGKWEDGAIGDESAPARFFWKGGIEEMLPIAQKLANVCGVITMLSGSHFNNPTFVFPELQPET